MPVSPDLSYPFETLPEPGEAREVAPGIFWVRMPLQLTGLDHINLWLLEDGDGWTIVDTGMKSDRIRELWDAVFARHLGGKPVTRVLCTHFHPDHMGQAGWLTRRWGCRLWATRREWLFARMLSLDAKPEVPDFFIEHYRRVGFAQEALDAIRAHGYNNFAKSVTPVPEEYRRIQDGEEIDIGGRAWRVIVGHGHAPEHACLYSAELNVMISGDQVLPRITPHIGVYPSEPDANPLQEYLDSLDRYRHLPEDVLLLPAHGMPFRGLHARLDALDRHHQDRLTVLEELLSEPKRVMSTLKVLYRRQLKPHETFLGVGEAIAHLNCLTAQGRIVREMDEDGVWIYRRNREAADAA